MSENPTTSGGRSSSRAAIASGLSRTSIISAAQPWRRSTAARYPMPRLPWSWKPMRATSARPRTGAGGSRAEARTAPDPPLSTGLQDAGDMVAGVGDGLVDRRFGLELCGHELVLGRLVELEEKRRMLDPADRRIGRVKPATPNQSVLGRRNLCRGFFRPVDHHRLPFDGTPRRRPVPVASAARPPRAVAAARPTDGSTMMLARFSVNARYCV